jgi:hypothetical protein
LPLGGLRAVAAPSFKLVVGHRWSWWCSLGRSRDEFRGS